MPKSVSDLRSIIAAGGGVVLNAGQYSTSDLRSLASAASGKGSRIVLKGIDSKSTSDLRSIASAGNGEVILDMTI